MKKRFKPGDQVTLRTKEDILNDNENFTVFNTLNGRRYENLRDKQTKYHLPDRTDLLGKQVIIKFASYDGTFYNLQESREIFPATMFKEYFENEPKHKTEEVNLLDRLEKFRDNKLGYLSREGLIELLKIVLLMKDEDCDTVECSYFNSYEPDLNKIIDGYK